MSAKSKLQYSLQQILSCDKTGSYATQYDRRCLLFQFTEDVIKSGYKVVQVHDLKTKHIQTVVNHWQQQGLSNGALKNRLSAIRHLVKLINKSSIVPNNKELGIGARKYVPVQNRAIINPDFSRIINHNIRISLELQRVYGFRREESLKIKPHLADRGGVLELQPSWCKGGRGRFIPIRTDEQRYWLERAKEMAGKIGNSLIPGDKNYIQQRNIYDKQVKRAGLSKMHGLRHAYAQQRYKELAGWEAPINGGPTSKELTPEQKEIDYHARMVLTEELGHSRIQITVNYCGR